MTNPTKKDKRDYEALVERVREINTEAAEYLKTDAKDLHFFLYDGDLTIAIIWDDTPQKYHYWYDINNKLELKDIQG